jgi:hypothetical protein
LNANAQTWLFRIVHVDNLPTLLERGALHAPNATPNDGLVYHTIHDTNVQASRSIRTIPCGPGGTIHDYCITSLKVTGKGASASPARLQR